MVSRGKRLPLCLAKTTVIDHGYVEVGPEELGKLFNQKLQQSEQQSKISDLKVEMKGDEVLISGSAHKGMDVHFSVQGPVEAFNGRDLRLHARKVNAMGIPVKGLMEMIGVELGNLVKSESSKGIITQADSIFFDPEALAHIKGHIAKAQITDNKLEVSFTKAPRRSVGKATAGE